MDISTEKAWPDMLLPHMPTVNETLAKGDTFDLAGYKWDDMEMATLIASCVAKLYDELVDDGWIYGDKNETYSFECSDDWMNRADHLLGFMLTHSNVDLAVFGVKVMLTSYSLPMHPGKMSNFNEFHRRCGQTVMNCVETDVKSFWNDMADKLEDIIAENPAITPPPVKMKEKEYSPSNELNEQRERQLAEKAKIREQRSCVEDLVARRQSVLARANGYGRQEGIKIPGQECTEKLKELDRLPYWN